MEDTNQLQRSRLFCPACFVAITPDSVFCDGCGYPHKGTDEEQTFFMSERNARALDLEEQDKKISKATSALKWVGGLTAVYGFVLYLMPGLETDKSTILVVNLLLGVIYFCLGIWGQQKPMAAIVTGFSLYVIVQILSAIVEPESMIKGIILKVIIVVIFVKGINAVIEAERIKKEHNF